MPLASSASAGVIAMTVVARSGGRRNTLGHDIRMMQFGFERRKSEEEQCTMGMYEGTFRSERALPGVQLSFEHLRIRCGHAGLRVNGEITLPEARRWLSKAPHKDVLALAAWEDPPLCLQRPVQAALLYICDKDTSWVNCKSSLLLGRRFLSEIVEFGHDAVTKINLQKILDIQASCEEILHEFVVFTDGVFTALALCVFIETVMLANKRRLGITDTQPAPEPDCSCIKPHRIDFRNLMGALDKVALMKRTPLLVCHGKELLISTFFGYSCATIVDAKELINEVLVKKSISLSDMREKVRLKVTAALRFGKPLQIRLGNSAMDWDPYVGDFDGALPPALFHARLWQDFDSWSTVVKREELEDSCISMESHFVFITSEFDLAGVQEHLSSKLPMFDSMAIIDIDPDSICPN